MPRIPGTIRVNSLLFVHAFTAPIGGEKLRRTVPD